MADTLKWPKDTATIVKLRAKQQQEMTKSEATLNLRLQVAKDIETFISKEFDAGTTRDEMQLTLEIFRFYAEQAPILHGKLKTAKDKLAVVKTFVGQCAKFGGRGGNTFMGSDDMFAESEELLVAYLQRGLIDLVTCWSALKPEARKLFIRAVLDSPKNYATTIDMSETVLFDNGKTSIQRWQAPTAVGMGDILEDWLEGEANDSIYTGVVGSGSRQKKKAQLQKYATETQTPEAYHLCWSSVVNAVIARKDFDPKNHSEIIGFFKQNVPAITDAFRTMVPEEAVRDFVNNYLSKLLANPILEKKISAPTSGTMELLVGELNKVKEVAIPLQVKLQRATNEEDRQKILDEYFVGKTFTRRIDDKACTFERYDSVSKKYFFKLT